MFEEFMLVLEFLRECRIYLLFLREGIYLLVRMILFVVGFSVELVVFYGSVNEVFWQVEMEIEEEEKGLYIYLDICGQEVFGFGFVGEFVLFLYFVQQKQFFFFVGFWAVVWGREGICGQF